MTNETGREPDPPRKTVEAAAREGDANDHTQDDSDWLGRLADWIGDGPTFVAIWGDYLIDVERHKLQRLRRWADEAAEIRGDTATLPELSDASHRVGDEATRILRRMNRLEAAGKLAWNDWTKTWERRRRPTIRYRKRDPLTATQLLAHFTRVRTLGGGWQARCPAHEDRTPSLSIKQGDRWWLLWCHAGCTSRAVCQAVGLQIADLWLGDE